MLDPFPASHWVSVPYQGHIWNIRSCPHNLRTSEKKSAIPTLTVMPKKVAEKNRNHHIGATCFDKHLEVITGLKPGAPVTRSESLVWVIKLNEGVTKHSWG